MKCMLDFLRKKKNIIKKSINQINNHQYMDQHTIHKQIIKIKKNKKNKIYKNPLYKEYGKMYKENKKNLKLYQYFQIILIILLITPQDSLEVVILLIQFKNKKNKIK